MEDRQVLHRIYISIGSNLGNRAEHIEQSVTFVRQVIGRIIKRSGTYESEAWGFRSENRFYNLCLEMETRLSPREVIQSLMLIEENMGRERTGEGYQDRTIDLDLLFYDDIVTDTANLTLPHPGIPGRRFVLAPLADIAPGFIHPVLRKSISILLENCPDPTDIRPV